MGNLASYKKKIKDNIKLFIESNLFNEARSLIEQYEVQDSSDEEIYSMKAVMYLTEGDFGNAEILLKEGLLINNKNVDLLYNLAYLYETLDNFQEAYKYYQLALECSVERQLELELQVKLKDLVEKRGVVKTSKKDLVTSNTTRKRVLVIAYYFPPLSGSGVQRTLKYVKYLREFGWDPVVVTVGKSNYPLSDKTLLKEIPYDIELYRVEEPTEVNSVTASELVNLYNSMIENDKLMKLYIDALKKAYTIENLLLPDNNILWANNVLKEIEELIDFNDIDLIYTTSGPYSDHVIGCFLKNRHNKPWVVDFRDEWTNNPYAEYVKDGLLYQLHYAMESKIVKTADKVITVTPPSYDNYKEIFNLKEDRLALITNGYDEEDFKNIPVEQQENNNNNNKFTITHNGLFYSIRTPLTFLQAVNNLILKGLIKKDKIIINFTWSEAMKDWEEYINNYSMNDFVKFHGYLNHQKSLRLASKSDLLLLVIGPGEKNKSVYTGKIFEYLRLCRNILSLSPKNSIVEDLILELNRGKNVDFDDIGGIEQYILSQYQLWEKGSLVNLSYTDEIRRFERKSLSEKLSSVFNNAKDNFDNKN